MLDLVLPVVGLFIAAIAGYTGYVIGFDRGWLQARRLPCDAKWETLQDLESQGFIKVLPLGESKLRVVK